MKFLRFIGRWLKSLGTAVVVLGVILCFGEVALRVYDSHCGQVTRCELYDTGYLVKSRTSHTELKPLYRGLASPGRLLTVNSDGLQGSEVISPKPAGTYRVIYLGDERIAGLDVPFEHNVSEQLTRRLPRDNNVSYEVWNGGVPGSCPLLSCLQYRHRLSGLQADLVVFHFDWSDVWDDYRYRRLTTFGSRNQPLICSHPRLEPPRFRDVKVWHEHILLPEFVVRQSGKLLAKQALTLPPPEIDSPAGVYAWLQERPPDWSVYIEHALSSIVALRDHSEGQGATFVVSLAPAPWHLSASASSEANVGVPKGVKYQNRKPFEIVSEFCRKHDIWLCDTSRAFMAHSRPEALYQHDSVNFTAEGHELMANVVANFVTTQLDGPWRNTRLDRLSPEHEADLTMRE